MTREHIAAAIALLKAAMTDDSEGVHTLMDTVPHRELVLGLLAVCMSEVGRLPNGEEYLASLQAAFIAEGVD
ncbi:hypothetical protein [Streptomyces sp. TLI_185]|uniref:hypothetical protein n=1 Tax=Streptomyces sp. TLI_185 TaxID=2485151 RepID=UPI000F4E64D0|nr:hypothetical protein [Streptomyces sp. TLI_185]RPF33425.1 hypothetical protein EDD92_3337 [Streptomyces sp. TLI_185]